MHCPECGEVGRVLDSRPHQDGRSRRRECACGCRYSTMEMTLDEAPEEPLGQADRLGALRDRIENALDALVESLEA